MLKNLIVICLLLISQSVWAYPTAKLTVKVIDETGSPVEGAKVGIGFSLPKGRGQGAGSEIKGVRGITDGEGLFTAEGESEAYVGFGVKKEGYYRGSGKFNKFTDTSGMLGFRKYKPWNPTVVIVLKKIINPIEMYAISIFGSKSEDFPQLPLLGQFVGFDLVANDWVIPHGLGTHWDFLFKVDVKRAVSNRDYDTTLTLQFPNQGDGLIEYPDPAKGKSTLRLPHHAPTSGYQPEFVQRYENNPSTRRVGKSGNPDYDTNYFFRIRTELDEEGNVIGGLYGKIYGEIRLGNFAWLHDGKPYVVFKYYLNPNDNDTNIEFDPKKNLFKNLTSQQEVKDP